MKRLLTVFFLAVLPCSVFAADPTFDSLLLNAARLRQAGKVDEARRIAEQVAASAEKQQDWKHLVNARQELSFYYVGAGNYERVLQLRLANLETFRKYPNAFPDSVKEEDLVWAVGAAYSWKHDYVNAIKYCRQNLALEEALGGQKAGAGMGHALQRLGINLYLAGQYAEAEQRLQQAYEKYTVFFATGWSDPRAVERYEFQVEVLRWLERVQVAQKRYAAALETAELSRSRAFAAALASRATGNDQDLASPSLARMQAIAREHNSTLVEYSVLYEFNPDLLLLFSDFEIPVATIYIWVVQPDGRISFRESPISPQGPPFLQMVKDARRSVGAFGRGVSLDPEPEQLKTEPLKDLYNLLIAPIASALPREPGSLVTFVPQDWLFMVPFAALKDNAGHYLIEQHAINAAPSLGILDLTHQELMKHQAGKGVLVVGNPAMPSLLLNKDAAPVKLNQLPQAEAEARAIAARFHATPVIGTAATKDAVLRRIFNAQIVHFATHGLLDQKNGGLQGALALAPAADDPGFLTVLELQSLVLNADLVVLSACDTAIGKLSGDGILGFSRAFLAAGTPSVVVSLWAIPDESTSYLMEHFYQRLERGEDKAQSLRGAMLDTKQKFPNPGSWAAFTLQGESAVAPGSRNVAGNPEAISREQLNLLAFTFPLPPNIYNLSQRPNSDFPGPVTDINFYTAMPLADLLKFYKTAMEDRGLKSIPLPERPTARNFSLVYRGPWGDREIGISASDFSSSGAPNTRSVTLRFELRHDDDAEFSPADSERKAGIAIPPHATRLSVSQKFQLAQEQADITFLTSLSADQVRAVYMPQLKKMGFAEYLAGAKKNADSLTLEFHRLPKGQALFLSIGKSFSHPERQEVRIRFAKPSAGLVQPAPFNFFNVRPALAGISTVFY